MSICVATRQDKMKSRFIRLLLFGVFVIVLAAFLFSLKLARDRQPLDQLFCRDLQYGISLEEARTVMQSAGATAEGTYWLMNMHSFTIDGQFRVFESGVTFDLPYEVWFPENQAWFSHTSLLVFDENRLVWKGYVAGPDYIQEYKC
jgi:hypothetical protein